MAGLIPVESIHTGQQARTAWQLYRAARKTPSLETEFPLAARNYRSLSVAYRRLGNLARQAENGELRSNIVCAPLTGGKAIGMASAWQHRPADIEDNVSIDAVELSYWHQPLPLKMARDLGGQIVSRMAYSAESYYDLQPSDDLYMATLETDGIKQDVLDGLGFVAVEGPAQLELDDVVNTRRIVFAAPVAQLVRLSH